MSAQPRTPINTLLLLTPLIATGAMTLQTARPAFAQNSAFGPSNPFYAPSTLPPFDKIKDADYQPAIEAGMAQQRKEVDAIADDRGVPTFENTLVAMETNGRLLDRAMNAFELVSQANLDPALQKVKDIEAPKLAAHEDAIFLNAKLFLRVTTIYNQRVSLKLDSESQRLLDFYYRKFVHAGAKLSDADKDRLKKLNEEESTLSNTFTTKLLAATKDGAYKSADEAPLAGLSSEHVTGMFHEFGHALHAMFANTEYPSLAGTAVPRDFVEFPSQFNEHWASHPAVFNHYAKNYKTGASMPVELAAQIKKSETFNQGYAVTELLAAAELDMQWHTIPANAPPQNSDTFETEALQKTHLTLSYVPPRYRSSYFAHIWSGGYAAGYYAHLWSEMLDDNAFQWFEDHGGMTRGNGDRFRQMVLSRGNTEDLPKMFAKWLGAEPNIEPMMKYRGLLSSPSPK